MQNQQGGGSGSSMQKMMQKLKQTSGQQQKLNSQIQKHLNDVQGKRLSPSQQQRRKELARQQRRIKQQLQNMDVGSEARQKLLGDLQKIAEQMEKSAEELEQGQRPSRDLLDRQQQILTRLLNAQSSLRTQGKKKKRTGQSADEDAQRKSPGRLPSADDTDQLRRDLIRALEMGYSSDYEALIKRYFDLLRTNEPDAGSAP
jgi:chromosome segregation ATPase